MARKSTSSSRTEYKSAVSSSSRKSRQPKPVSTRSGSDSELDSDAPETVTLTQSRRFAHDQNKKIEDYHAGERQKRKVANKERDKLLKERKAERELLWGPDDTGKSSKRIEEAAGKGKDMLTERMARAMRDALEEEEDGSDEEDEDMSGLFFAGGLDEDILDGEGLDSTNDEDSEEGDDDDDEWGGIGAASALSSLNHLEDHDSDSEELLATSSSHFLPQTDAYLPDHMFESAFAAESRRQQAEKRRQKKELYTGSKSKPQKSKRKKRSGNDINIGTRTFRVLDAKSTSAIPSAKAKKFYERTLGLRGAARKRMGWERRAVNIGVMKTCYGPARSFVRGERS